MEKHVKPLIDYNLDSELMGIIAAVVAIVITLVIFAIWRRKKAAGNSILLSGITDAGKTLIYARLLCSKFVKTHTSVKENIGDVTVNNRSLKIIDIPGHERLRYRFFDKYKSSAKGLVYVIDSVTFQKDIRDVAEYLYTLLSDRVVQNIPVLVLCNKQDQTMAKGATVVKALLEKEMNLLRLTKSNQLESTDATAKSVFLGKEGKEFEFSQLETKIDFAESTALNTDPNAPADLEELDTWLQRVV